MLILKGFMGSHGDFIVFIQWDLRRVTFWQSIMAYHSYINFHLV